MIDFQNNCLSLSSLKLNIFTSIYIANDAEWTNLYIYRITLLATDIAIDHNILSSMKKKWTIYLIWIISLYYFKKNKNILCLGTYILERLMLEDWLYCENQNTNYSLPVFY